MNNGGLNLVIAPHQTVSPARPVYNPSNLVSESSKLQLSLWLLWFLTSRLMARFTMDLSSSSSESAAELFARPQRCPPWLSRVLAVNESSTSGAIQYVWSLPLPVMCTIVHEPTQVTQNNQHDGGNNLPFASIIVSLGTTQLSNPAESSNFAVLSETWMRPFWPLLSVRNKEKISRAWAKCGVFVLLYVRLSFRSTYPCEPPYSLCPRTCKTITTKCVSKGK